jgi:hypothetical protein
LRLAAATDRFTPMKRLNLVCLCVVAVRLFSTAAKAQLNETRGNAPGNIPQLTYSIHRLGTDHAEGITTADMNGDGKPDILSGSYWYENPGPNGGEWKRHQYRTVEIIGEFVSDCGEWAVDVNHDGAPDVVTVGWMTDGVWWYENPKKDGVMWERHLIAHSIETEGGWMADINGDGKPDLALAHYGRSGIIWIDFAGAEPKAHHAGGHDQDGHGVGMADIDGDGKIDILTPWVVQEYRCECGQMGVAGRVGSGRKRLPDHRLRRKQRREDRYHLQPRP